MIPIRDTVRSNTFPLVNTLIIAVKVRIPPGVKDGAVLRLKGLGRPAPHGP